MNGNLYIRDGLDIIETGDGRTVLISGNSLGFEIDDVVRAVLSVCDGRTSGEVVNALKDHLPEEDICDALEELRSVGAIQVGVLQRFLGRWVPIVYSLLNPLENLFRWSIRGHGDGLLEGVNGRDLRVLLYTFSTDPSAIRIPAGIIRERIPGADLHIRRFSADIRNLPALVRALRKAGGFDLAVGVYDFSDRHPYRGFGLTWMSRWLLDTRVLAYVDRYDFLPHVVLPFLLSVVAMVKGRICEAMERAAIFGFGSFINRVRRPSPESPIPGRILVLAPGGIGDVVLAIPALRYLRGQHPDAHIACLVPSGFEGLFSTCRYIDEVIPSPIRGAGLWRMVRQFGMAKAIRARGFDMSVTLRHWTGQACNGFLPHLAGIQCRIGPIVPGDRDSNRIFTHPVAISSRHQADAALEVVGGLGERCDLELETTETNREFVKRVLEEEGVRPEELLIGIHPGSSADVKQWPPERFGELADRLSLRWGGKVVLTGGPGEVKLAWEIASHQASSPVIAAGNLTLPQFLALIERCDLLVCGDSGPMHLADALGTPLVALFGPTDPAHWGPRSPISRVVRRNMICGPRSACAAGPSPECPRGEAFCIREISVGEVLEASEALLGESRRSFAVH